MTDETSILETLKKVQDPDLGRDIVSLGFVKNLRLSGGKIDFDLELTTPACPVKDQLKSQCEQLLKALPGVETVEVRMTSNVRPRRTSNAAAILPQVKNLIAVASGKGGVGKSTVAANLALV